MKLRFGQCWENAIAPNPLLNYPLSALSPNHPQSRQGKAAQIPLLLRDSAF